MFETTTSAQFLIPMAVSLATGIVFASVIILFLVPALVMIREDLRLKNRVERKNQASLSTAA
ncbi:MAG: putative RND superfamily exporter protein [Sulfitobacter sp.]